MISNKHKFNYFLPSAAILLCVLLTGCITSKNFESLPRDAADFQLPYEQLAQKYPEVPLYAKFRGLAPNMPPADNLIEIWGKPDVEKTNHRYFPQMGLTLAVVSIALDTTPVVIAETAAIVFAIRPVEPQKYVWYKDNYCIETGIDTAFPQYRRRVARWEWTDSRTATDMSEDCKEAQRIKATQQAVLGP